MFAKLWLILCLWLITAGAVVVLVVVTAMLPAIFAAASLSYNNNAPHSRLPPLGWSSWVALGPGAEHPIFDYCDEWGVKAAIDAFHDVKLYEAGYRHFHLDDCWAGARNASGFLYPEQEHFPNGMAPIAAYAHSKGLAFGLYTCAGTKTCVGGRPGSKDHWHQDAAVFAEWGVDWVKMDWCNTDGMEPKEAFANMSEAMNATGRARTGTQPAPLAPGEPGETCLCASACSLLSGACSHLVLAGHMHLNMCEWGREAPWEWGGNIAQSWRMSNDHVGRWSSTKDLIRRSAAIPAAFTGRPWAWNDMDMLETGNYEQAAHANGQQSNMTADEYQSEFSMWAISASPLMVTTPIMNCTAAVTAATTTNSTAVASPRPSHRDVTCKGWISDLQKRLLLNAEVLGINQDVTPQGRPLSDTDLSVWARHLSDGSVAVALYNERDNAALLSVDFSELGLPGDASATVRDLWAKADEGTFSKRYPANSGVVVAAHATKLLRITPTRR